MSFSRKGGVIPDGWLEMQEKAKSTEKSKFVGKPTEMFTVEITIRIAMLLSSLEFKICRVKIRDNSVI